MSVFSATITIFSPTHYQNHPYIRQLAIQWARISIVCSFDTTISGVLLFEHDKFTELNLRTSVGPHIGYQFYETTAMNLSVNVGVLYVDEDFDVNPDNDYSALGWLFYFDRFLVTDRMQFYHLHESRLDVSVSENFTINSWTVFRLPLYKGIVASTEAEIEYEGGVPDTLGTTDTTYRVKLGYQW